jgi:hypothetical protein
MSSEAELREVESRVAELRKAVLSDRVDLASATSQFNSIKISLTRFQLIPPFTLDLPITKKQLSIARKCICVRAACPISRCAHVIDAAAAAALVQARHWSWAVFWRLKAATCARSAASSPN